MLSNREKRRVGARFGTVNGVNHQYIREYCRDRNYDSVEELVAGLMEHFVKGQFVDPGFKLSKHINSSNYI